MPQFFDFRKQDLGKNRGLELIEVTPVILGGDPIDPNNKALVSRTQHFEVVRYWNGVIAEMRASADKKAGF